MNKVFKKIFILFINCLLINCAFAQSQQSFDQLILETNKFLNQYEKLNAFGASEEYISFKESGLPKEFIKSIIADKEYAENLSSDKDSIAEFSLIMELQDFIMESIDKIIAHDKFKENDILKLINHDELSIIRSDDGKLYNFSIDEKTGGTYRSRISKMYFTDIDPNSLPTIEEINQEIKIDPYLIFEGDGFNEIFSINTEEGTKYILTGDVRGCSYCFESNIMLAKFKDGVFYQEFLYSVNSRGWEGGIFYDHKSKTITVDYITDDLTTNCDCNNYSESEGEERYYSEEDDEPITKKCHCTFEFNGVSFELIKESWEKVKE